MRNLNNDYNAGKQTEDSVLKQGQKIIDGSDISNDINPKIETPANPNGTAGALTNVRNAIAPAGTPKVEDVNPNINDETNPNNVPETEINSGDPTDPDQVQIDYDDVNNTDFLFKQMLNGEVIQGQGVATEKARKRRNNFNSISSLSPKQIGDSIIAGTLEQFDPSIIDIKNVNPELFAGISAYIEAKQGLDDINAVGESIYDSLNTTKKDGDPYANYKIKTDKITPPTTLEKYNKKLFDKITAQFGENSAEMFTMTQQIMQNPEIQLQKDVVGELDKQRMQMQENIYNLPADAKAILGSSAPDSLTSAYISQQTRNLQTQLRTIDNELLVEQGKLSSQMEEVDTILDAFYKGMKMDADLAEAELKAKKGSGGSGGGSRGGGADSSGYNNLFEAMASGSFGGSYSQTAMKTYGLGPTTKTGIKEWIGNNKSYEEILNLAGSSYFTEGDIEEMITNMGRDVISEIKAVMSGGGTEEEQNTKILGLLGGIPEKVQKQLLKKAGIKGSWFFGLRGRRGEILDS